MTQSLAPEVNHGPCVDGPWRGRSISHPGTVRAVSGVVAGSPPMVMGSYVWHRASREWRWLCIGVPHS